MAASRDVNQDGPTSEGDRTTKPGPANPQGSDRLDAPTPPGGPLRSDAPSGPVAPGGPGTPARSGEPEKPMRTVEEPVGPRNGEGATTPQEHNAESSQGEPSDDSGH